MWLCCYALLIVWCLLGTRGSIVVCINSLTSIMMDQKEKFTPRNLLTEFIGEQTDALVERKVLKGEVQLVLISPESLYRNLLVLQVYKDNLVALVVDEAHCVKKWGDEFRTAFSRIWDLRSIIPSGVNVMALTATSTTMTYHIVCERLSMKNPTLVAMPPHRKNIFYMVLPSISLEALSTQLSCELLSKRRDTPKTIVFVRQYSDICGLYLSIAKKMGASILDPIGSPYLSQYRMVDMYTRVSTADNKESMLARFATVGSTLRLIIATLSFGMGVDCPDIRRVYHWGVPEDLEQYVQESGRGGRDGKSAEAVIYCGKVGKHPNMKMREYLLFVEENYF